MRSNRLAGHTLPHEGRVLVDGYLRNDVNASAVCSCGWESGPVPTTRQRQMSHFRHKNEERAKLGQEPLPAGARQKGQPE